MTQKTRRPQPTKCPRCPFVNFQPFTSIDGVNASDIPSYGGAVVIADYCPFLRVSSMGNLLFQVLEIFQVHNKICTGT